MQYNKIVGILLFLIVSAMTAYFALEEPVVELTEKPFADTAAFDNEYGVEAAVAAAQNRLSNAQEKEKAAIVSREARQGRAIALAFDGMPEPSALPPLLAVLKKHQMQGTFFIEGINAADQSGLVREINQAGQQIGNYTFTGISHAEALPAEKLLLELCRTQQVLGAINGQSPSLLRGNRLEPTESLRRIAWACGLDGIVTADMALTRGQLRTELEAAAFVSRLQPGMIVSFALGQPVDVKVPEGKKAEEAAVLDKIPGLKAVDSSLSGDDDLAGELDRLLTAMENSGYKTVSLINFQKVSLNSGDPVKLSAAESVASGIWQRIKIGAGEVLGMKTAFAATAPPVQAGSEPAAKSVPEDNGDRMIATTMPAVIYTFGGLENEAALDDVLSRLQAMKARGTFFVLEIELQRYPERVKKIIASGQEIGIAIRPAEGESAASIQAGIERMQQKLRALGVETSLVKQPWLSVTPEARAAVAAAGCRLIGQSVNVVQTKDKDAPSAAAVLEHLFGPAVTSLGRGQIVHFRLDYYTNPALAGELMEAVKQSKIDNIAYRAYDDDPADNPDNDSAYSIVAIGDVLQNKARLYQYPVPEAMRSTYQLAENKSASVNYMAEAYKRYLGNPDIQPDRMTGFSHREMRRFDNTGRIHTTDPVIFFTFDDWGMDDSINKLLYVLRKHKVTGTFFIITQNVKNNPNLLRAIGEGGNEIASHSDAHLPMAAYNSKTEEAQMREKYMADIRKSYEKLVSVVGDQSLNGRYALTRFFRSKTMDVSRMGLECLFDSGYQYIVCGSYATRDYNAASINEMLDRLQTGIYSEKGINRGAILVMHMSASPKYTARALDVLLTANELRPAGDPLKFRVGRLSDYLKNGYSQFERSHIHNLISPERDDEHERT
jgi:Predicted xylanase/chitin deacetylase